jgi:hypothetical protein
LCPEIKFKPWYAPNVSRVLRAEVVWYRTPRKNNISEWADLQHGIERFHAGSANRLEWSATDVTKISKNIDLRSVDLEPLD